MKRSQYSREMGKICPLGSLILAALVFICFVCSLHRECTRGGFCNFMHLKPISRELRRELYGRRRKRYKLCMSGTSLNLRMFHILSRFLILYFLTPTAASGLGLGQETGGLARGTGTETGTGVEEAAVTMRDVAPETENVRGDSELRAVTTCPPCVHPCLFLSLYPCRSVLGLTER